MAWCPVLLWISLIICWRCCCLSVTVDGMADADWTTTSSAARRADTLKTVRCCLIRVYEQGVGRLAASEDSHERSAEHCMTRCAHRGHLAPTGVPIVPGPGVLSHQPHPNRPEADWGHHDEDRYKLCPRQDSNLRPSDSESVSRDGAAWCRTVPLSWADSSGA